LQKLKVSGGGRCNVTHGTDDLPTLLAHYPRTHKQLKGQLMDFTPSDMRTWLARQGVHTLVEKDGRVFPVTNDSQTIIDAFMSSLKRLNVPIHYKTKAVKASYNDGYYSVDINALPHPNPPLKGEGKSLRAKRIILATGSTTSGYALAESLGISLTPRVPSLFTFVVKDVGVHDRAGVSIQDVALKLRINAQRDTDRHGRSDHAFGGRAALAMTYTQRGPMLFTHWGLSGPAVLKLSALGAEALFQSGYNAMLSINALPNQDQAITRQWLGETKEAHPQKALKNVKPGDVLPQRYWDYLLQRSDVPLDKPYCELSKKDINKLCEAVHNLPMEVEGKGIFKEEFVTAGGVDLATLSRPSMEVRDQKGVYVVGELLNVDGMTGGFNFQHCWSSAVAVARAIQQQNKS